MSTVRSKWFAVFAVLFLMTVGALAADHCHCDEVAVTCEHAGQACATPDDCSDCVTTPAAVAAEPEALLPSPAAKAPLGPSLSVRRVIYVRPALAVRSTTVFSDAPVCLIASVALRSGALSLRV